MGRGRWCPGPPRPRPYPNFEEAKGNQSHFLPLAAIVTASPSPFGADHTSRPRIRPFQTSRSSLVEIERTAMITTTPNPPIPDWAQLQVGLSDHPVIIDSEGVLRYKAKPLTRWLSNQINLNTMWGAYNENYFSRQEFMQFYREIGYTLVGFEEIWGDVLDEMQDEHKS